MSAVNFYEKFETDNNAETHGIWVSTGTGERAPCFLIAHIGASNKRYSKILAQKLKAVGGDPKLLSESEAESVMKDAFVEAVLLNWENVPARDGSLLEYNRDNALSLLTELPKLYERLDFEARDFTNFKKSTLEKAAKKSQTF